MRELLPELLDQVRRGPVALARIIDVTGAGPREVGAAMLVTPAGEVLGSLSGGCVESAVVDSAATVLRGADAVVERFGVADPDGIAVGLTCGGEMEIFVERVDAVQLPLLEVLHRDICAGHPVALVTSIDATPSWQLIHPGPADAPPRAALSGAAPPRNAPLRDGPARASSSRGGPAPSRDALGMARAGRTGSIGSDACEGSDFPSRAFVQSFGPPARMILAGANDFVRALSRTAAQLGYRVTVVDARETFTTPSRFPAAQEVVVDWPHRYLRREHDAGRLDSRTVVCVLTHDPKFDVPLLAEALAIPTLAFVGALGSRQTHSDRRTRLIEAGLTTDHLRRLRSPLGLDLNARTPEETAISIAAQIIAETGRASARPLSTLDGPIHY
ncbi:xanthine dehydrogenase accessory protein XdhC [Nocardia otitidiscaviarum]|uniref:Xanthine dehydrogenase accessory protein XdhC n=1 Tax=Nocardia otitidiscaviarum TaxID=1823 RepID=A0A378YSJ0_9NOCA|nr:XdhC/CoxI family protein [Nocardia otitidiscaviarum]SUA79520.1 xanthine dehydrogenase accessory protein XdhC [Nocardia otitidiscaviarum]